MASGFSCDPTVFRMLLEQQMRFSDLSVNKRVLKKYTTKKFLLKDFARMVKDIPFADSCCTTLVAEPHIDLSNSARVKLLPKNRVRILNLLNSVDKPMKGKFLLCRTISPPLKMTGVIVLIDDPDGFLAARYAIYNVFPETGLSRQQYLDLLPVGTIMAVKNPYFKTSADGGYGLRTDNSSEVTFLNEQQCKERFPEVTWKGEIPKIFKGFLKTTPKTAEEWKVLGNEQFVNKNYLGALNAYMLGLKEDPRSVCLLSNRSATYLQMFAFRKALNDAEEVLKIEPFHVKAVYRKAKALCGLKKYKNARDFLASLKLSEFKESYSKELSLLESNVNLYVRQSEKGEYDLPLMLNKSSENAAHTFDYADYTGPVEVRESRGKGRGLFATDDIKPGQLLIGAKAFALYVPNDSDTRKHYNWKWKSLFDPLTLTDREDAGLADLVARILTMAPERGEELYRLYAGPKLGYLRAENGDNTEEVDNKRIKCICTYNSFEAREMDIVERQTHEGLWLLPSMINHSCYDCNCCWMVFGDFMLIRAYKPIPRGGEIIISYISPDTSFPSRMEFFERRSFLCDCSLCEIDQQETRKVHQKRERWMIDFANLVSEEQRDLVFVKCYLSRIASLRRNNPKMNIHLIGPLMSLCSYYRTKGQFAKAAETHEKVYELIRDTDMFEATITIIADLLIEYITAEESGKVEKWAALLKETIVLAYGQCDMSEVIFSVAMAKSLLREMGRSL